MPITQSAHKALRQNLRRRKHNLAVKIALKKNIRGLKQAVVADRAAAHQNLPLVYKALDKAAKINIITKNTAARLKSRLTKLLLPAKPPRTPVSPI